MGFLFRGEGGVYTVEWTRGGSTLGFRVSQGARKKGLEKRSWSLPEMICGQFTIEGLGFVLGLGSLGGAWVESGEMFSHQLCVDKAGEA